MEYVLGILLILASLILIVAVLLQSGKGKKGLSGAIAGGSDSFFGKNQADSNEKKLAKITTIVAIVFVVAVIVAFVFQNRFEQNVDPNAGYSQVEDDHEGHDHGTTAPETDAPETDAPEAQGTEAAE
ncbi:MAG: preprotein translocase subunit SecG [Clostridia bacterium]|nr:preprotein translocase subunit SecG [Clostridia bacterium]